MDIQGVNIFSSFIGAFFAFIFFVFGQAWISSNTRRKDTLFLLTSIREYIVFQIYVFKIDDKIVSDIVDIKNPISIFLKRFSLFPIENYLYSKIGKYSVAGDIAKFVMSLKSFNDNILILNGMLDELSNFSRIAMLEEKEIKFKETMSLNLKILQDNAVKFGNKLETTQSEIDVINEKIIFAIWYEKSYFWQKFYFKFRCAMNKEYKDKFIKVINQDAK